uniref:Uncharacterized protein n=1 Tax=Ananas comosus var. bracteatus TaxID=296719 RepID=A0A6V7PCJ4_ANACO|nr:unnamed protein product [Ananas comosus var. bracteatus]
MARTMEATIRRMMRRTRQGQRTTTMDAHRPFSSSSSSSSRSRFSRPWDWIWKARIEREGGEGAMGRRYCGSGGGAGEGVEVEKGRDRLRRRVMRRPLMEGEGYEFGTMALIAHQTPNGILCHSCFTAIHSLRYKAAANGVIRRSFVAFQFVCGKDDEFMPLKHRFVSRDEPIVSLKRKVFKVSSFKSNAQNDEHETKKSGSKFSKSQVQLSSSPDEREDLISKSHDSQKHPLSYPTQGEGDTKMGSIAIQKLFKKWLIMLRTQTSSITINGTSMKNQFKVQQPLKRNM